jgi:hypothetical protein
LESCKVRGRTIEEANLLLLLLLLSEVPSSPVDSCSSQDALHQPFHAIVCQEEIVSSFMPTPADFVVVVPVIARRAAAGARWKMTTLSLMTALVP